jgi:hypothetical protein
MRSSRPLRRSPRANVVFRWEHEAIPSRSPLSGLVDFSEFIRGFADLPIASETPLTSLPWS